MHAQTDEKLLKSVKEERPKGHLPAKSVGRQAQGIRHTVLSAAFDLSLQDGWR